MENTKRQRHAFVSVWLWLSVIGSAIYLLLLLLDLSKISLAELRYLPANDRIQCISSYIYALIVLIGYIELLCWKIGGYAKILSITIVYIFVNLLYAHSSKLEGIGATAAVDYFSIVVSPLISMTILFLILKIKKDAHPCDGHLF